MLKIIEEIDEKNVSNDNAADQKVVKLPKKVIAAPEQYSFRVLFPTANATATDERFPEPLKTPNFRTLFLKWGLSESMAFYRFSYDPYLHAAHTDAFLKSFFTSPEVCSVLRTLSSEGQWRSLSSSAAKNILYEPVQATSTNLSLFDPLYESERGVLRENGAICGCLEEVTDDNELVRDMLQQVLFNPSHEEWDALPASSTRKEFLFSIMCHVVKGGAICQYEDCIEPYLETCKAIYKEMVGVQRTASGADADALEGQQQPRLRVTSTVYRIKSIDHHYQLFPSAAANGNTNNFLYLSIDPLKRHVNLWYNGVCN